MWLSAAALVHRADYCDARAGLRRALRWCRELALSEFEADVLLDLARCERDSLRLDKAYRFGQEALDVASRSGRELQRIDAHLVLVRFSSSWETCNMWNESCRRPADGLHALGKRDSVRLLPFERRTCART
jgi:hypothetical protein